MADHNHKKTKPEWFVLKSRQKEVKILIKFCIFVKFTDHEQQDGRLGVKSVGGAAIVITF